MPPDAAVAVVSAPVVFEAAALVLDGVDGVEGPAAGVAETLAGGDGFRGHGVQVQFLVVVLV